MLERTPAAQAGYGVPLQDGTHSGNEGTYSGYAALPTPAAVGLAGADRVLTPEVYNAAPDSDPDYASGPLPFGGVSSRVVPFARHACVLTLRFKCANAHDHAHTCMCARDRGLQSG